MNKLVILFAFILFMNYVSAFGITPAQRILDFQPGTEQKVSFEIINSEKKDFRLLILPQGELNQSIFLSNNSIHFTPDISSIKVEYVVKIPEKLKPGPHSADISVIEISEGSVSTTTFIGSVVGLVTKVVVDVPYPGKYIESLLSVTTSKDGKTAFVFPILNKGNLDIKRVKANVDILTPSNEKIDSVLSEEISILSEERKELAISWDTSAVQPGKYRAVATLIYDEETINLEKEFTVGTEGLQIKNVEVNDFSLGEIAKFEFLLQNNFNYPTSGTYILMQVFDKQGDVMAEFKSASYDIQPFESKLIVSFWDTEGVKKGTYEAKAFINSGETLIQKPFTLEISDDDITVVGVGYVVKSADSKEGGSLVTILVIVVVVLIIINLTWFLAFRKKLKKK